MATYEELKRRVANGGKTTTAKSRFEELKERVNNERFERDVQKVDPSYINTFLDYAGSFMDTAKDDYDNVGWGNALSTYRTRRDAWDDLDYRRSVIQRWAENNKANLDADDYTSLSGFLTDFQKQGSGVVDSFSSAKDYYGQFDTEDAYNQYKAYYDKWGHYADAEDYKDFSAKGAAIKNPTMSEVERGFNLFGNKNVGNIVTYSRDNYDRIGMSEASGSPSVGKSLYHFMRDDEVGIYNYLLAKEGDKAAQSFLDDIEEELNYRMGKSQSDVILGMESPTLRAAALGAVSLGSGVDQWGSGVRQLLSSDKLPTTAAQFGNANITEHLNGFGKELYTAGNTIGNMAPSILLSNVAAGLGVGAKIAQGIGSVTLGASASGNAYGQALADGYNKRQARLYSALVGASEAGLQSAIGGIASLGGLSGKMAGKIAAIDNSLLRIAAKMGTSIGGEIVEEELQNFLEPAFRSILFGEDYDAPKWDELLETAVVTALSTGLMEGPGNIGGDIANSHHYKKNYGEVHQELVSEGLEFADGTLSKELAQKYQKVLDANGSLNGYQLGRMVEANEQQFVADDMTTIQNAAKERLTALGETGDLTTISAALAKQAAGEKLTRAEEQVIANSKYGQRVANEMNADNIAEGGFASDWAQNLGTNRINAETYNAHLMKLANETAGVKPTDAPAAKAGQETVAPVDDSTPAPTAPVTARYMASDELAVVAAAVKEMGVSPMVEQSLVDNFDGTDGRIYAADVKLAYQYGKMNFPKSSLEKLDIKPYQAERAYMLGRSDAKAEAIAPKVKRTVSGKRGTVIFETAVDENTLTPIQKASINGIQAIADLSGLNVHVFESQQTEDGYKFTLPDGTVTGANGWYVTGTNDIWVDLNAGNAGEGTMLYTASHEISHFIKEWSHDKWRGLADTLLEQYSEDVPLDALLERQMEKIRKRDASLKGNALMDAAYEELVSDALSEMLTDGRVVQKMAELKQKDRTLWEKIKDAIHALLEKWGVIRKEYEGRSVAPEAEFLRGMDEAFNKLQHLYAEAFVEASENYAASEQVLAEAGIAVNAKTDSASLLSVRDVLTDAQRNKVANALAERFGVTKQEAMEWLKAETSMASIILNPKYSMYLDYEGDPNELAIKQNSDYPQGTVDFSNICKKRREFTQVMNRVLRNFPRHVFAATDLAKIRTIMGQEGMTLPCGICYVEDRRQLDSIVAQDFIDGLKLYREGSKTRPDGNPFNPNQLKGLQLTDGDTYVPTIYELVTLEGRNSLKAKNPNMEAAWVKYNNARGMNAVRLLTNEAEYKRQILKYNAKTVQSKNDHGGLRIYSFSNMEMFHLIDIVQVITDSAAVGLKLQGYTKVNEYARAVKDTGEKLNRSLIPAGDLGYHMEGGKVVLDYDTVEGIDIHHKDFFDNKDNPNVGNIVIGINDTQIRAAMLSDFIDQIIPFHTGLSKDVLGEKGISAWENYKDYQNEKDLATGKTSKKQINIYTDVIQAAEQEGNPIQNKRQFVEKFLEVCKKNGLKPRFAQFLNTDANGDYVYTEGYHKFLVDFKTFAQTEVGEYLPQMPVKPIFDDAYITGLLRDYVKEQKAKDAQVAKQMPKVVERIANEIVKPGEVKLSDRDITQDPLFPPTEREAGVFKRSYMNKAGDLKAGETKGIIINTSASRYYVEAVGSSGLNPFTGEILKKVHADTGERISATQEEYDNGTYDAGEEDYLAYQAAQRKPGRGSNRHRSLKERLAADGYAQLLDDESDGDSEGNRAVGGGAELKFSERDYVAYDRTAILKESKVDEYLADYAAKSSPKYAQAYIAYVRPRTFLKLTTDDFIERMHIADQAGELDEQKLSGSRPGIYLRIDQETGTVIGHEGRHRMSAMEKAGIDKVPVLLVDTSNKMTKTDVPEITLRGQFNSVEIGTIKGAIPLNYENRDRVIQKFATQSAIQRIGELHGVNKTLRFSDRDYMSAVENGDMIGAELAVERAANLAMPDSKIRGADGNLIPVYHGTREMFYEFDTSIKGGLNGTAEGFGIYTSDDPEVTSAYGNRQIKMYANITKPATSDKKTISPAKLAALIKDTCKKQARNAVEDGEYDSVQDALMDTWVSNYVYTYDMGMERAYREVAKTILQMNDSDMTVIQEVMSGMAIRDYAEATDFYRNSLIPITGFDGFATHWENSATGKKSNIYLAFDSGQLKSADAVTYDDNGNVIPLSKRFNSSNNDIRYSDRDTDSVSNRDLLAGAFEDIAQNDIERGKIQEYRAKVEQLNEQEQKLAEIRKELKELSFAKGPRDKEKISKLRDEAAKIANRIGIVDKQLLRLEASAPLMAVLEREKKLAYGRASQKWGDRMETARTGRNKTEMRHKIKRVVNELNQLLLNGSKDRHVMIGLQKATAEALSAINMDTVTADVRLAKIQEKIDKATNPAEIAKLQQTYARVEKMGMNMATRLTALKNAYEDIKDSKDPLVANAYQPEIEERIKNLRKMVGDTPLQNMTMEQLEYVYDTYKMVLTTIRDANKAFKNTKGKTIAVLGNQVMEEIQSVGGKHPLAVKALKGPLSFAWSGMKPVYAFKAIGSDTLSEMFDNIRAGEDTWAVDVSEAKEFYRQKTRQYHFDSWDFEKQYSFTSKTGKKFDLTLEQIMSLYAYSKRKQADAHLDKGGFVFDDAIEVVKKKHGIPVKYTVNTADAHNLSYETLMAICKTLTGEQVKFVDEMQEYLSSTMGGKGNEVSLDLYGVKLFKEKYYFPLKSAKQYMHEQNEVAGDVKIKNSGFSKQTVEHASNPVILSNFTEVWANHVNDMAMYHAFVLPLEDFNRVFYYKTPNAANADTESVKMYLKNAYGRQPEQYILQLLTDLNGGARSDPNAGIINKGIGMFKKAAVFSSLSVVVQQPSSIARAAALIDTKYFVNKPSTKAWDEVKKYAPIAIIKEMGYFDTNMGVSTVEFIKAKEYTGAKAKMAALVTDSQYRDEILSKAPAVADEMAWCYIWEAVKKETAAKGLKGEELLQAAGKRFTEVIVSTQVYDSVLSRSGLMRSKDTGMKMATAFMAEPTTSLNMITDALIQGKRGNKAYARKAIGSVIASMILNSILVSFVYAGRDDDEDKTYVEKYIGTLTEELMDSFNPLTLIPFVKDIVSIAQGYDVERSDMAVVTDLYKAWKNLSSSNRSVYRKVEDFAGAIAAGFSLPVKNIMRDMRGMYNTVMSFVRGPKTTGRGIGEAVRDVTPKWLGGGERSNGEELYHAMLHDDAQHAARVKARFKNEIDVAYAIRDGLVKNDPRITAAAEARVAGKQSEYMRIAREITSEKHFSQDDVVRAINYVTEKMRKVESTPSLSDPDTFKVLDYFNEAMSNDQAEAELVKREMISKLMKEGKTAEEAETSFNSSFKNNAVKPAFAEGKLSVERAVSLLQKYGGMDEDMATADVQYWAFKQNYPDIPVDDSWFDKYYEYAADVGIPIDTFMKYKNEVKGIDGEGKKARRMAVIDSLPLTYEQKDALYYSEGWVASTIHDAPWH